jgi:small subunit ribosomal protein S16
VLRIRLRRVGTKKQPNYRIVVADSRAPRDGAFIETIGLYNPLTNPATVDVKEDRAREWLGKGAVPSERVVKLLASKGIGEMPTYTPKPKKAKEPEAGAEAPAAAAEPAAAEAPAS